METELLKVVGQVAGIGGIALGVFLLLFRDLIRQVFQKIFPQLTKQQATDIIKLAMILIWSLALVGILAWIGVSLLSSPGNDEIRQRVSDNGTGIVQTGDGNITVGKEND